MTDKTAEKAREQMDPEATAAHATRILERMRATPYGPKRKRLADQHVELCNRVHYEQGYLAALTAILAQGEWISVLREPTEAMLNAGRAMTDDEGDIGLERARGVWWAMNQAAALCLEAAAALELPSTPKLKG